MRVLLVVHGFPPTAQGGAEVYAAAQARVLRARGDDVLVLTREADDRRPDRALRHDRWRGVPVVRLNNTFRHVRSWRDAYADERVTAVVAPVIDDFAPDLAHLHHLTCLSTGIVEHLAACQVPIVHTLHDYWLLCHRGQMLDLDFRNCDGDRHPDGCGRCLDGTVAVPAGAIGRTMRRVGRRLPPRVGQLTREQLSRLDVRPLADAVHSAEAERRAHMRRMMDAVTRFLAPSRCVRDAFVAAGVETARIAVHPYGFEAPPRGTPPSASTRERRPLRLAFLGSLMVSKGPDVLIDACARLPEHSVTVDFYGATVPYHGDHRFTTALDGRLRAPWIRAHGPIPHDAVIDALRATDVVVVPSIWRENSPLVIHEAFLAGVPVVAARIGGIPEVVVDGQGGLLFDPGDAADLARVLTRLVDDPALLPQLRRTIPGVRSLDDDVDVTRRLYTDLLARRSTLPAPVGRRRRLAAVVLNYRAWSDTLLAVRSLLLSMRPIDDLIVVDNDGEGHDAEAILGTMADRVHWIAAPTNLGYTGGMNLGARAALERGADLVLLVNSDVVVPPGAVGYLEAALASVPDAGIAGPAVLARPTPDAVATVGMTYDGRTGRMRHPDVGRPYASLAGSPPRDVDGVSGCCMLITRAVIERIGLFDDAFFFGFEDLDLCLRARAVGIRTIVVPATAVLHEGGRSIGPLSLDRLRYAARNHLMVAGRPRGSEAAPVRWLRVTSVVALNAAHAVRARGGTLAGRLQAVGQGVRDYVAGRVGPLSSPR